MPSSSGLKEVVAPLMRMPVESVGAETPVTQFNNSLERAKLAIGLKRLGLSLPEGKLGPSLGDLEYQLNLGSSEPVPQKAPTKLPGASSVPGPKVGIDIETVDSLPEVADFWEDGFYKSTFTGTEIAYALLQTSPRMHLCGAWCAKEALRKSGPDWITIPYDSVEVAHREDGSPFLRGLEGGAWKDLPCALSISHTPAQAVAVVAWSEVRGVREAPLPSEPTPVAQSVSEIPAQPTSMRQYVAILLSFCAFALSVYAVIRSSR